MRITKHQVPSTIEAPSSKSQRDGGKYVRCSWFGDWSLEFLWSLEFGVWCFPWP
jgi:hypothetical protein